MVLNTETPNTPLFGFDVCVCTLGGSSTFAPAYVCTNEHVRVYLYMCVHTDVCVCVCIWHDKAVGHLRLRMCARRHIRVYIYVCVLIRMCVCIWHGAGVARLRLHRWYCRVIWACRFEAVWQGSVNISWRRSSMFAPTYVCLYTCVWVYIHMCAYVDTRVYMHCNTLPHTATHCNTLQHTAKYICVLVWIRGCICHHITGQHLCLQMCVHMITRV